MTPLDCRPKLVAEMKRRFRLEVSAAEDAVDEAIARLLIRVEIKKENIFPILFQISKNILLDRQKHAEVARRNQKILRNSPKRPPGPLQDVMTLEFQDSLKQELLTLRERDRMAFELHHLDGLSYEEISLKLGMTVAYSKVIVSRVRMILRGRLERFAS